MCIRPSPWVWIPSVSVCASVGAGWYSPCTSFGLASVVAVGDVVVVVSGVVVVVVSGAVVVVESVGAVLELVGAAVDAARVVAVEVVDVVDVGFEASGTHV